MFEKLKTITLNTKIHTCSDIEVRYCKITHFIMFVYVVCSGTAHFAYCNCSFGYFRHTENLYCAQYG